MFEVHENEITAIVDGIMKETEDMIGTWSTSFCKDLEEKLKPLTQKHRDFFVKELLERAKRDTCNNSAKLKVAQLLSCMKSLFLPQIISSIENEEQTLQEIINSINPEDKLAIPTKKMFATLIQCQIHTSKPKYSEQNMHRISATPTPSFSPLRHNLKKVSTSATPDTTISPTLICAFVFMNKFLYVCFNCFSEVYKYSCNFFRKFFNFTILT